MEARNNPAVIPASAFETLVRIPGCVAVQCDGDYWMCNEGWKFFVPGMYDYGMSIPATAAELGIESRKK